MSDQPRINLFVALHKAISQVGSIGKDQHANYGGNFAYTSADYAIPILGKALTDNGIICIPSILEVIDGNKIVTIHMQFTLVHAESGEYWTSDYYGHGNANGDKGVNIAATYCHKYFLLKLFFSGVGNEDEGAAQPASQRQQSAPQQRTNGKPAPTVNMAEVQPDGAADHPFEDEGDRLEYFAGLFNDPNIKYGDDVTRFISTMREKDSGRAISQKQYGYLTSLVNDETNGAHGEVLSLIFGRSVSSENPPQGDAKILIDWLSKGSKKEPKEPNSAVVAVIRFLGDVVRNEVAQADT